MPKGPLPSLKRQAKERLDRLLLEGLETPAEELTPEYLEELRRDGREVIARKQAALLRDIDAGLADLEAGRVYDGEEVFSELLGEEEPQP